MSFDPFMYVKVVGEPYLSQARAYKEGYRNTQRAWSEFGLKYNGTGRTFGFEMMTYIEVDSTKGPCSNWVKVRDRSGTYYRPRKNTPEYAEMQNLPKFPDVYELFPDIPTTLGYKRENSPNDHRGWMLMSGGRYKLIDIGWHHDEYLMIIPNVPEYIRTKLEEHSDYTFENNLDKWKLPAGLEQITKAQFDLIFAQAAVDEEKAAKADPVA